MPHLFCKLRNKDRYRIARNHTPVPNEKNLLQTARNAPIFAPFYTEMNTEQHSRFPRLQSVLLESQKVLLVSFVRTWRRSFRTLTPACRKVFIFYDDLSWLSGNKIKCDEFRRSFPRNNSKICCFNFTPWRNWLKQISKITFQLYNIKLCWTIVFNITKNY